MQRLLTNCRIVNPYGGINFIENGFILIEDEAIAELGEGTPNYSADETIDLKGKTVLPGMINAHTHLYSSLAMGMPFPKGNPKNFTEILEQIWWILDRALDENSTRASFEAGLLDHLRHGVTTVIDHHSSPSFIEGSLQMLANAAEQFGMNISGAFEMSDRNGEDIFKKSLKENLKFHKDYQHSSHIRPLVGLHASFTLSDESLKTIAEALAQVEGWGIHIHTAEDKVDQEDTVARGYNSVLHRLETFRLLNKNSLVIHGVHFQPGDVEILSSTGAMLVHNPSSNANNCVGMTPSDLIESVSAGLGTDGMQGNMLAEAKEGTLIRSSHLPGGAGNVNYLELLFKNNAEIATRLFGRKIGKVEEGYSADLAIYDYHPRTEINGDNWGGHLLFGFAKPTDVITNGIFRIKDCTLVSVNESDILENAAKQAKNLWNAMELI